ncbi:hypothetical protein [Fodinicola feengrottensis]|uniref:hypothetical protein n=1 Tax=Fodinicola feengrottensis TaxID=435914 RepID=UPI002441F838|nr:hypothetical protein [Fodinicola feengrottensis]
MTNETDRPGMPKLTLTAPADHWIVAEIALPEFRYLYYRGAWHQIHNQFLTALARGEDSTLTTMMQLGLHRLVSTRGRPPVPAHHRPRLRRVGPRSVTVGA